MRSSHLGERRGKKKKRGLCEGGERRGEGVKQRGRRREVKYKGGYKWCQTTNYLHSLVTGLFLTRKKWGWVWSYYLQGGQFLIAAVSGIVKIIDVLTGAWRWKQNHTIQYHHGYTYCTVSSWIHLLHSIVMDTPNAQYRHEYTYCTVSSWVHLMHSIIMNTHSAEHHHGHEHSCTIVSWWNLLPDHSCWIAGNGTTLRRRLGAGTVFTPGKEVEYKRLIAVLTCDLVNTSQTLRTTSRGVLPALFPGHSQILSSQLLHSCEIKSV